MGSGLSLKLTASWSVMLLLLSRMPTCSSLAASRGTMTWALPADMNANRATMCWEARRIKSGSKLERSWSLPFSLPLYLLLLFHLQIQDHCFGNNIKTFWVVHCLLCLFFYIISLRLHKCVPQSWQAGWPYLLPVKICFPIADSRVSSWCVLKDSLPKLLFSLKVSVRSFLSGKHVTQIQLCPRTSSSGPLEV